MDPMSEEDAAERLLWAAQQAAHLQAVAHGVRADLMAGRLTEARRQWWLGQLGEHHISTRGGMVRLVEILADDVALQARAATLRAHRPAWRRTLDWLRAAGGWR